MKPLKVHSDPERGRRCRTSRVKDQAKCKGTSDGLLRGVEGRRSFPAGHFVYYLHIIVDSSSRIDRSGQHTAEPSLRSRDAGLSPPNLSIMVGCFPERQAVLWTSPVWTGRMRACSWGTAGRGSEGGAGVRRQHLCCRGGAEGICEGHRQGCYGLCCHALIIMTPVVFILFQLTN